MSIGDNRKRAQGVKAGTVSSLELDCARGILRAHGGDINSALYVVGLCAAADDALLIEPYLRGPARDVHGETALKALVRYLGLADRYRPLLRKLIMSPTDLGWMNSRMSAIHLAKDYFKDFRDDELGCELVAIFCNPSDQGQPSARGTLVDILGIRDELGDPFGLELEAGDTDAGYIVKMARQRFNCHGGLH
ncbi:hypothetical protein N7E70_011630 [Aminobacter sp. NyZ550]|uniref:hypothetical protein n=1 Tax=Aminobacter sp. NyZ550 TaxID=2979870 RepID=UPI0021D5D58E|nr:hypothetical protein [Aminobacter sp. NyZ550]WAX97452.1 hypothetical protein N7E70_011630 [Aminobacter sp. NyZ550]